MTVKDSRSLPSYSLIEGVLQGPWLNRLLPTSRPRGPYHTPTLGGTRVDGRRTPVDRGGRCTHRPVTTPSNPFRSVGTLGPGHRGRVWSLTYSKVVKVVNRTFLSVGPPWVHLSTYRVSLFRLQTSSVTLAQVLTDSSTLWSRTLVCLQPRRLSHLASPFHRRPL